MIILRPVKPASPLGPQITNFPVGLMWKIVFSSIRSHSSERITSFFIPYWSSSKLTLTECWFEITTVATLKILPSSYSQLTWVLPSGWR